MVVGLRVKLTRLAAQFPGQEISGMDLVRWGGFCLFLGWAAFGLYVSF